MAGRGGAGPVPRGAEPGRAPRSAPLRSARGRPGGRVGSVGPGRAGQVRAGAGRAAGIPGTGRLDVRAEVTGTLRAQEADAAPLCSARSSALLPSSSSSGSARWTPVLETWPCPVETWRRHVGARDGLPSAAASGVTDPGLWRPSGPRCCCPGAISSTACPRRCLGGARGLLRRQAGPPGHRWAEGGPASPGGPARDGHGGRSVHRSRRRHLL